jgi:hypothetical protein
MGDKEGSAWPSANIGKAARQAEVKAKKAEKMVNKQIITGLGFFMGVVMKMSKWLVEHSGQYMPKNV